jgi:hypothetical protein
VRRQEVLEADEPEVEDVEAVEDEDESLLEVDEVLEDDVSPEDLSELPAASVDLEPERESVR